MKKPSKFINLEGFDTCLVSLVSGWQDDYSAIYIYDIQYVISTINEDGHRIGHIKYAFI
jgi:hypothetical protein